MHIETLKAQAAKILDLKPASGFAHVTFATGSGGAPRNTAGIPEVHRECAFAYPTVANGPAYSGSVTIECRDTGALDADGRKIYETPDGLVFVYAYYPGSPYSFDRGWLEEPRMATGDLP